MYSVGVNRAVLTGAADVAKISGCTDGEPIAVFIHSRRFGYQPMVGVVSQPKRYSMSRAAYEIEVVPSQWHESFVLHIFRGGRDVRRAMIVSMLIGMVLCLGLGDYVPAEGATDSHVFSVLYNQRDGTTYQADWLILAEYEQRMNVRLDVRIGNDSDYLAAVIRTLDVGNAPDIILKVWPSEIASYASSGALLAFSDYESLMPHFMAYITENGLEEEVDKLRLANGKYYILPGYQRPIQVQQWIYRKDVFDQYDLGVPDTFDELLSDLEFLQGIFPETTPLTACWGGRPSVRHDGCSVRYSRWMEWGEILR